MNTFKNSVTYGPGFLSVSNIDVDLVNQNVFADIVGANGVGSLQHYQLWSFGSTQGLFASSQALELMNQALNLNSIGRAYMSNVNDPTKFGGAGFGTLVLSVPEPSRLAMLIIGALGLGLVVRRRKQ